MRLILLVGLIVGIYKSKNIKKLLRKITILLVIFSLFNMSGATPLLPAQHKPVYCFNNCHGEQGFSYGGEDECGDCHNTYFGNPLFKEQHEPKTCSVCHKVNNKDSYHILHNKSTTCQTCHIDNTIPENKFSDCIYCHVSGLHSTHLEKQCDTCHYENKIQDIKYTNDYNITLQKVINTHNPITNYERFTIYEVLLNLYKAIIGDIL
jgi:hypothetical protein